jgi:hypothetical protein
MASWVHPVAILQLRIADCGIWIILSDEVFEGNVTFLFFQSLKDIMIDNIREKNNAHLWI